MTSRNARCPCGSGQKYKQCCLGADGRRSLLQFAQTVARSVAHLSPPPGLDPVTTEAYLRSQEVMRSADVTRQLSDCMGLLRKMFQEGGPLASLRWPWEELVPPVERHIFRVMEEVEDTDERHDLLFQRCAPELLSPERLARMDQVLRRELMSPERTAEERRALALAVMELVRAPRKPPYTNRLSMVAWMLMGQVDEWVARRQRTQAIVDRALGQEPGTRRGQAMSARTLRQAMEEPEVVRAAVEEAMEADPGMVDILGRYESKVLHGIISGRTPDVLHGEEWLWMTVVLREALSLEKLERGEPVDVEGLLARLDEEVRQAVLKRVEAASRDRTSLPEAEQWFLWAYKVLLSRPLAFFGAFAKAREAQLRERFEGEAELVGAKGARPRVLRVWPPEPLAPGEIRRVVVEAQAPGTDTRGAFVLRLAEAGGPRTVTLRGVTFP